MLNAVQKNRLIAFVIGLLLTVPFLGLGQNAFKEAARAAKLTPDLLNIQLKAENRSSILQPPAATDGLVKRDRTLMRDGMVAIEAISVSDNAQALLRELQAKGLTNGVAYGRLIFGYFPTTKLGELSAVSDLRVARPYLKPSTNVGRVTSQGDQSMRSDVARQTYGVNGAGTKVGILSDSYDALGGAAAGVASDDLPPNVEVLEDLPAGDGSDEGRAMAEIVHDVAPGANIAFATAFSGQAGFANNIIRLANAGCNVIVDDVIYFAEPFFQDGIIAQAVNQVAQNGVSYFSSAGNNGRDSYQSPFVNSGTLPPADPFTPGLVSGVAHDFGSGVVLQRIRIAPGSEFFAVFQWSNPFASVSGGAGATTDMDIFVYYNGVLRPDLSSFADNIGRDPYEDIDVVNNSNAIVDITIALVKYRGPDPALIKWVNFGGVGASLAIPRTFSSTTYGHANAEGAIATAAARYNTTPPFNTTLAAPTVEGFSSAGGTPILFNTAGESISPIVRQKPEITAPNGGNNTFFGFDFEGDGFPNFFGTSASAPHAAGVAALIRQRAGNTYSNSLLRDRLQSTAIDMDDPLTAGFDTGFDFRTGYGFIQADRAVNFGNDPLALLQPTYNCATGEITFNVSGGDGSTIVFSAVGVQRASPTSPTGVVEAGLRADPKPIVITATQGSVTVSYTFDFAAFCAGGTPTPPTSPTTGGALTLTQPTYNCTTGEITFNVSGGDGSTITYSAVGVQRASPTSNTGIVEPGLRADPKPLFITATQGSVTVSIVFDFAAFCAGGGTTPPPTPPTSPTTGGALTLTQPTYNCATGAITFNVSGGDGSIITYSAVGVQRASPTSNTGTVEAGLRADPKPLVITATQSGVTVSITFDFAAYCAGARVAAVEPSSGLDVKVLGNPSPNEWADVEIRGAENQRLQLRLSNGMGALTSEQTLEMAGAVERYRVLLGRTPGLYLLQISTPTQTKTVKIIRQQ